MPRMTDLVAIQADFTHIVVEAKSLFTGDTSTMKLPLTLGEFQQGIEKWDAGAYVQNAFPTLNAVQREFLMTGISESEQATVFAEPDEEDEG